jgi:heme exporter protein A
MRLVANELAVRRGDNRIFSGISFTLSPGEALVVTGANGAGKSTLLKTVAGLIHPFAGRVTLEEGGESTLAEQCHYLGHENGLKSTLTVRENLVFWQSFLGPGAPTEEALEKAGLGAIADLPAGYLSAGQKRRAAIARLLATSRTVWLVDEPTAGLDSSWQSRFSDLARNHLGGGGIVVAATHQDLGLHGASELALSRLAIGGS